jgi:hypothetical protein
MDPKKISDSRKVTNGQVKRTLRGMDGRISHIETLASRWETRKIEETCAAAVARAVEPLVAEIASMAKRVVELETAHLPPVMETDAT